MIIITTSYSLILVRSLCHTPGGIIVNMMVTRKKNLTDITSTSCRLLVRITKMAAALRYYCEIHWGDREFSVLTD